jgi:hypothetical protein
MCSAPDRASTSTLKVSIQKSARIGAFTTQCQCMYTVVNVFPLTDGWHAIQHLGDKPSAFFLEPLLLNLTAEGVLTFNIMRPCCLVSTINRGT